MLLTAGLLTGCDAGKTGTAPSGAPEDATREPIPERPGRVLPEGGVSLFDPGIDAHRRNRGPDAKCAEFEMVSGQGTGFEEALRCRVMAPLPEHPWYAQLSTPVTEDLRAGQLLLLSLWARTVSTSAADGQGEFLIYFGTPGDDNTLPGQEVEPAIYRKVRVGPEWTQLLLPVQLIRDYEKKRTSVNLDFGFAIQTLEFTGIQLRRYVDMTFADLPATDFGD